ncbi:esterase/lipase family protein [Variovorax boronicumulans]
MATGNPAGNRPPFRQLPTDAAQQSAQLGEGYATPTQDPTPQLFTFAPMRVLPIIFLPGIMGSNLRITDEARQRMIGQGNNKAWRPDDIGLGNAHENSVATPRNRQLRIDPRTTAVDSYDPKGAPDVSGDERNNNVKLGDDFSSPLLYDDPKTKEKDRRTAVQKARRRGWGEVMFKSYGQLLQHLEQRLNSTYTNGKLQADWSDIVGADPAAWAPERSKPQQAITEDDFKKAMAKCRFPVYAFGYNWLQSNRRSAVSTAARITAVIDTFKKAGFDCEKVIIVTHSMGGFVARGIVHPDIGNLQDSVLGIVHGVQPAIGAAAAYKRMRAGFEDPGMWSSPTESIASKVTGNVGDEVTAVLANAPGGLELLPNKAYGNGWLQVNINSKLKDAWPKNGDPYEEIYKVKGKWYSLFREEWINPSGLDEERGGGTFDRTIRYLDEAKTFHDCITNTYHSNSYAHYGTDVGHRCWGEVVWEVDAAKGADLEKWDGWAIDTDTKQGELGLVPPECYRTDAPKPPRVQARIAAGAEPGDGTVPQRSARHQLRSGKFSGVFEQAGYDHQGSYQNRNAIASTLYSIVRIAQKAEWKDESKDKK